MSSLSVPKLKMSQTKSMPALNAADIAARKLEQIKYKQSQQFSNDILNNSNSTPMLQRSKSMADIDDITMTWRNLVESIPFMAIPGVSNELGLFKRTVSSRHMTRIPSSQLKSYHRSASKQSSYNDSYDIDIDDESTNEQSPLFGKALELFDETPFTTSLGLAMSTAILSSFQVGYSSSVMNVPEQMIKAQLNCSEFIWSGAVAIFALGALGGSLVSGRMADKFGRKNFLIMNNVLFIIGGLIEALAFNSTMLVIARILLGIGSGGATVVVPLYLGEIAPADLRGALGTMNQFATVIGILVAVVLGKPLGTIDTWRYLLGVPVVPAILQLALSPVLLESPLWLVGRGTNRAVAQAEDILSNLRGDDDVSYDIELMIRSRDCERAAQNNSKQSTLSQLADYRLAVFIGLFLQVAQQFSGINGVFYYSTSFFASAGVSDPWLGSVLACAINVAATGLAIYLMDIAGRRLLLIVSSIGMAGAAALLTVALYYVSQPATIQSTNAPLTPEQIAQGITELPSIVDNTQQIFGYLCVAGVLIFVSLFEMGLGPIPWLIGAEIFPSGVRATAMTSISSMNWLANFAIGLSFPHINKFLNWLTFVPFGVMCIITAMFTIKFVPETKGKSFQQIQNELGQTPKQSYHNNTQKSYGSTESNNKKTSPYPHAESPYQSGPLAPLPEEYDVCHQSDLERGSNANAYSSDNSTQDSPSHHIIHNVLELQQSQSPRHSTEHTSRNNNIHNKKVSFEAAIFNSLMKSNHNRQHTPDTIDADDTNEADQSLTHEQAAELARKTGLSFQPHVLSNSPIISHRSPSPIQPTYNLPPTFSGTNSRQSSGNSTHSGHIAPSSIPVERSNSPLLARDPSLSSSPKLQYSGSSRSGQRRVKESPGNSPLLPPVPRSYKSQRKNSIGSASAQ